MRDGGDVRFVGVRRNLCPGWAGGIVSDCDYGSLLSKLAVPLISQNFLRLSTSLAISKSGGRILEHLVGLLQSILGLTVKQGWIFLIAGLSVLVLNGYQIGPFAKLDGSWIAVAGIAAVFGGAILVVSLGAYLTDKTNVLRERQRAAKAKLAQWRHLNEEARLNVEVLNQSEQAALAWILRNGQQRFQAPYFMLEGNLIAKGIVYGPIGATSDVYQVIDGVWDMRDHLLKRYAGIAEEAQPPWWPRRLDRSVPPR